MDKYSYMSNAELASIDNLYQQYLKEDTSVEEGWRKFFEGFEFARKDFERVRDEGKAALASQQSSEKGTSSTSYSFTSLPNVESGQIQVPGNQRKICYSCGTRTRSWYVCADCHNNFCTEKCKYDGDDGKSSGI